MTPDVASLILTVISLIDFGTPIVEAIFIVVVGVAVIRHVIREAR